MNEAAIYPYIIYGFIILAIIIFITLFLITAPYGRHTEKGWGPMINNRLGWILMETPASLLMIFYFIISDGYAKPVLIVMLLIWQSHYFHRTFIYPFTIRGSQKMPFSIMFFGIIFNGLNTYVQGRWLFGFAPEGMYDLSWFSDPRFIIGVLIFYSGYIINKNSDAILRNLRKPGETGYKIPTGGFYRFVSCPNYFGEILEWIGWAVLTWSLAGLVFPLWTAANLIPRAYVHHKWYKEKFPEYPKERKAVIPFLF